jgi:hypothetical protein
VDGADEARLIENIDELSIAIKVRESYLTKLKSITQQKGKEDHINNRKSSVIRNSRKQTSSPSESGLIHLLEKTRCVTLDIVGEINAGQLQASPSSGNKPFV